MCCCVGSGNYLLFRFDENKQKLTRRIQRQFILIGWRGAFIHSSSSSSRTHYRFYDYLVKSCAKKKTVSFRAKHVNACPAIKVSRHSIRSTPSAMIYFHIFFFRCLAKRKQLQTLSRSRLKSSKSRRLNPSTYSRRIFFFSIHFSLFEKYFSLTRLCHRASSMAATAAVATHPLWVKCIRFHVCTQQTVFGCVHFSVHHLSRARIFAKCTEIPACVPFLMRFSRCVQMAF